MIDIGYNNLLKINRFATTGAYLDGEDLGEILLPKKFLTDDLKEGDQVDVFIYFDSEDRIVATTQKPLAHVDMFALLKCVDTSRNGAFLDWGLDKDLFVPFANQKDKMKVGRYYFVYVYLDEVSNRIVASQKLNRFLSDSTPEYQEGERVDIFIGEKTDIGYKVIVDNSHWGIIYFNEMFRKVNQGEYTYGFVKKIRDDNRIDIMLEKSSVKLVDALEQQIYQQLRDNNGFIAVTDKSSPEEIYKLFGVSKKVYKKAVGGLYRQRLIVLTDKGIKLVD